MDRLSISVGVRGWAGFALVALLGAGCDMAAFAANTSAPAIKKASAGFREESDVEFARSASPAQLATAEGFLHASPKNRALLEVVARGYIEYAFGFLEDELERLPDDSKHAAEREVLMHRATAFYDRGLTYALRLLATDDRFFDAAFKKDAAAVEAEAAKLDKDSAPGLTLAGMAMVSSINLNRTDLTRVVELPKAVAMIKRAYQLDKTYANAAPAFLLALINGAQGKAMGGDPDAAKRLFDEAISLTDGKYLLAKVMFARFYGVVTLNREFFDKTLKEVMATPADVKRDYRLANELAKLKAARYLAQAEELF
jgi:hypothetical protein